MLALLYKARGDDVPGDAFIKINDLGAILLGKEFYTLYSAHNFFILSLIFLKLLIVSVAFFLGHPVYCMVCIIAARQIKAPALNNCNRLEIKDQNFQHCNKQINNNEHEIQIINIPLLKYYLTMHDFEIEQI